ncbi:MAG TPA: hypothetical protein VGJ48_25490 [Pyrinomonadaceae bacterium]|jgi:hypothetical protein
MANKPHKLMPAMVPHPLWGRGVYNELRRTQRRKQWEALRRTVLEAAANTCARCAARYDSHMVCNEIWQYDDQQHIATLKAFEIVCRDCDSVLHLGKSLLIGGKRGDEGTAERGEQAVKQLMKVNGIKKKEANKLIDDAFGQWMDRSKHKTWAMQIAPELIENHPVLTDLEL